ncbi:MAG: GTPase Era [Mycoplasma sp.]|nr:GTPase Era [Mycoplasma sp.]
MKCGFVAIVGKPNVGKSSLLNKIIDYDLAIISSMAQTTRNVIRGIYNDKDSQIIFIDTPGYFKSPTKLSDFINSSITKTIKNDVELVLYVFEALKPIEILESINLNFDKTIALITKIDLFKNDRELEEYVIQIKQLGFRHVVGVSIEIQDSIKTLINTIKEFLPISPPFYDQNELTDVPINFIIQEQIRLSVIKSIDKEIPHNVAVLVEEYTPAKESEKAMIRAIIYCAKESQKGILIGKSGQMIKKIRMFAQKKIEFILGIGTYLDLKVKVKKKWMNDINKIKELLSY